MWSETQLAYLAGIVDREGTISIFSSRNSTKGYSYPCYCPRVNVYNNNPALMFWLVENFGGKARPVKRLRWNTSYIWEISRLAAVPLLEAVAPYLILKREQANLFLKFRGTVGKRGGSKLTIEKVQERAKIMADIQGLNRRRFDAVVEFRREKAHEKSQVA